MWVTGVQTCALPIFYDYFVRHRGIELRYSGNFPCINAGRPKRPTYFPVEVCFSFSILPPQSLLNFGVSSINLESWFHGLYDQLCTLVPLQRYTKDLSTLQRSSLVEKSRQTPKERMSTLNDVSYYLDFI